MSSNIEIKWEYHIKLIHFLNEKVRKIYEETKEDKPRLDMSYIKTEKGFEKQYVKLWTEEDGYAFSNNNGCQCLIYFKEKSKRTLIYIEIDGISSDGWYGTIGMLYRCMDEIDAIAEEFRQLRSNLEKQEKIDEIAKNSINTWMKTIMQNQSYAYYTTESYNKITLSIKMENRMQLDIPIYYKRFQKIMPELLNTIGQFAKTAKDSKIKVLISNSDPNQQWQTKANS